MHSLSFGNVRPHQEKEIELAEISFTQSLVKVAVSVFTLG
jgi:hypothetical protein